MVVMAKGNKGERRVKGVQQRGLEITFPERKVRAAALGSQCRGDGPQEEPKHQVKRERKRGERIG